MAAADGTVLGIARIFGTASLNRAFNLVALAEGFTATEQGEFATACTELVSSLGGNRPV